MSIELNIDTLGEFNSQLQSTLDCFREKEASCRSCVDGLAEGWEGNSYKAFQQETYFILNGIYTQTLDDAKVFLDSLKKVKMRAESLKSRAEELPSIYLTGRASGLGCGRGVLFCDDSQVATVESTIDALKGDIASLAGDFSTMASDLTGLSTVKLSLDEGTIRYNSKQVTTHLEDLSSSISIFKQDLSKLESDMRSQTGEMTGDRFLETGKEGAVLDAKGSLVDPELALLLFKTPDHLLSPEELELVEQMKALGYTEKGLLGSQGPSVYTGIGLVDDVLGGTLAAGRAIIIKVNGKDVTFKTFTKLGRMIPSTGIGIAFSIADALLAYDQAYVNSPELATGRRISNAQAEGAISAGESLITVGAPLIGVLAGPVGVAVGSAVSVIFTLGSDSLWDSTIRAEGDDGKSSLDGWKNDVYDFWHKK